MTDKELLKQARDRAQNFEKIAKGMERDIRTISVLSDNARNDVHVAWAKSDANTPVDEAYLRAAMAICDTIKGICELYR